MVKQPQQYQWSSYHANALGVHDELVTPHEIYLSLAKDTHTRQTAYRELFRERLSQAMLTTIREATNKAWVLGNQRFCRKAQKLLQRPVLPAAKGGDRKSSKYKAMQG